MARKRHKPEEIVAKLRQPDALISQGKPVADAVRAIGVTARIARAISRLPSGPSAPRRSSRIARVSSPRPKRTFRFWRGI
jgi:hypothetical protein